MFRRRHFFFIRALRHAFHINSASDADDDATLRQIRVQDTYDMPPCARWLLRLLLRC